ncbi:hypothetical protein E3Q19_02571 [Wallemia mellicola]|nr:hypothetical protein E3Q19_02571 [Wallemia mellicola]
MVPVYAQIPGNQFIQEGDTRDKSKNLGIPFDEARYETLKWFRMDFERNRWESDPDRIKYQIQSMQREIKNSLPNYDLSMRPAEGFPRFWKQSGTE